MHTLRVAGAYVRCPSSCNFANSYMMRWLLSFLVLAIAAVASAKSFTGNRLLVVLEEQAEREKYSVFLEDLAGKCDLQLALVGEVRHAPGLGWAGCSLKATRSLRAGRGRFASCC